MQLDSQFLLDAQRFGILSEQRLYYRCINAHSYWTMVPEPLPDTDILLCANPNCRREIGPGRRRFCSDNCARPRKGKRRRRRPVN